MGELTQRADYRYAHDAPFHRRVQIVLQLLQAELNITLDAHDRGIATGAIALTLLLEDMPPGLKPWELL